MSLRQGYRGHSAVTFPKQHNFVPDPLCSSALNMTKMHTDFLWKIAKRYLQAWCAFIPSSKKPTLWVSSYPMFIHLQNNLLQLRNFSGS